jgi:hypothetical protein
MALARDERRRESRALTAALIEIADEHADISTCVLEDISSSGVCIHSDIALQVGVSVKVNAASVVHDGAVRHCKPCGEGFTIGIEFIGGHWPTPIEFPIHWIRADHI